MRGQPADAWRWWRAAQRHADARTELSTDGCAKSRARAAAVARANEGANHVANGTKRVADVGANGVTSGAGDARY